MLASKAEQVLEAFQGTLQTGVGRRFRDAKNTAAGRMLTVTLINDLDGMVYL